MNGHDLIRAERFRQLSSENHTAEQDVGHSTDLILAAESYLFFNDGSTESEWIGPNDVPAMWPWADEYWKPKSKTRDLIRAGALIAAAIDALNEEEKI